MEESPRIRIVTAHSRADLDFLVNELIRQGWEKIGDATTAKSVVKSEPPYLCQSMCRKEDPANEPGAQAKNQDGPPP